MYLISNFVRSRTSWLFFVSPRYPLICAKPVIPGLTKARQLIEFNDFAESSVMDDASGTRSDNAHIPKKDIQELRKTIKRGLSQEQPHRVRPWIACGSPLEPPLRLAGVMRKLKLRNGRLLRPPRVSREIKGPGDWML